LFTYNFSWVQGLSHVLVLFTGEVDTRTPAFASPAFELLLGEAVKCFVHEAAPPTAKFNGWQIVSSHHLDKHPHSLGVWLDENVSAGRVRAAFGQLGLQRYPLRHRLAGTHVS
jgi:hypothetical protein